MAAPQTKTTATEARLASLTHPDGGIWASTARDSALARLRAMGLPDRRDEYWKYTRPDTLVQADAPPAALFETGDEAEMFGTVERLKIVFVDGVFDAEASDDLSLEGVSIDRLAEAGQADIHWAKDLYGVLEERGQTPVHRPLATLNTGDGHRWHSDPCHGQGQQAHPSDLSSINPTTSDAILHHVIKLDEGADLTVLENGPAAARFNKVMEVDVARWRWLPPCAHAGPRS